MNKRKLKKTIKNSNGFLTIICKDYMVFAINESDIITFTKDGVEISRYNIPYAFIPYRLIKKTIIE
jgi:hypothetical protein